MNQPASYTPHDAFIRPAYRFSEPRRVAVMLIGFELILILMGFVFYWFAGDDLEVAEEWERGTIGTLAGFAIFGVGLVLFHRLAKVIHKRGIWSMIGPLGTAAVAARKTFIYVLGVMLAVELISPTISFDNIVEVRNIGIWLLVLPFALFVILIQCATEEIVYRGYLQQQTAVLFKSPIVYIGIPSVLFGLGHYWNAYGPLDGVLYVIWATLLGLACADLTARSGNIGAAVGLHTANNIYVTLLYGMDQGPGSGLALFLYPFDDPWQYDYSLVYLSNPWVILDMLVSSLAVFTMWLAARIAIRR